ncbi:MAG: hypothetical protein AAFU78_22355, partial [Cyanobacteria bacterium J06633_2]
DRFCSFPWVRKVDSTKLDICLDSSLISIVTERILWIHPSSFLSLMDSWINLTFVSTIDKLDG